MNCLAIASKCSTCKWVGGVKPNLFEMSPNNTYYSFGDPNGFPMDKRILFIVL